MPTEKICSQCGDPKPLTEFYKYKRCKDGHVNRCKACYSDYRKQQYIENKEEIRTKQKEYNAAHRRENAVHQKKWREKHVAELKAKNLKYYYDNKDKINSNRKANRVVLLKRERAYREANRDKINRLQNKRRRTDPKVNLNHRVSLGILSSLKAGAKKGRRWEKLTGYTVANLMGHLESLFQPGMSWDNFGEWHIDHIVPKAAFNFEAPEDPEFKQCWALENLQPLWAVDNLRKGAKLV